MDIPLKGSFPCCPCTHHRYNTHRQQQRPERTILVRCSVKTKPCSTTALGAFQHEETEEVSDSSVRPQVNPLVQHLMSATQHGAAWSGHPFLLCSREQRPDNRANAADRGSVSLGN